MKHPFYTLYYTGLAILISFSLFGGLLICNLSNIVDLIPKKQRPKINTDVVINPTVLETSIPKSVVKISVTKVEPKIQTPKPKVINDSLSKSTTQDSNHTEEEIKKETNDSTKTP